MNEFTLVGLTVEKAKEVLMSFGHTDVRVLGWLETDRITTGALHENRITLVVEDNKVVTAYRG